MFWVQQLAPNLVKHWPAKILDVAEAKILNGVTVDVASLVIFSSKGVLSDVPTMRDELGQKPGTFHVEPPSTIAKATHTPPPLAGLVKA